MSESTASKDSFALFAEFMRWKESQESSRNSSVPSGGVGDSGSQVEVQSSSNSAAKKKFRVSYLLPDSKNTVLPLLSSIDRVPKWAWLQVTVMSRARRW